jgi:hypothetical protein
MSANTVGSGHGDGRRRRERGVLSYGVKLPAAVLVSSASR